MKSFNIVQTEHYPDFDLKITLKPCFRCNHRCWFCQEYDNSSQTRTKDDCDIVLAKLKTLPANKQKLFFYFYGGEPTLSKHWEYLNYKLLDIFSNRELYLQTQTNLSINKDRLKKFLKRANSPYINICSSYHLDKQDVDEFIEKMDICDSYGALGLCFFSTEIPKEDKFKYEFNKIAEKYPDKIKLKFTEITDIKNRPEYKHLLEDKELVGTDNGKSIEYRYFMRKYPEYRNYFEEGWNFNIDGITKNYSTVKAENIHKQFKFMKCECGTKHCVIDHELNVFPCNDYNYKNIKSQPVDAVDFSTYFLRDERCVLNACYDGLDHRKYK